MAGALVLTVVVMASGLIRIADPCQPGLRPDRDPCTAATVQAKISIPPTTPIANSNIADPNIVDPNEAQNRAWLDEQIAKLQERTEPNISEPNNPAVNPAAEPNKVTEVNVVEIKKFETASPKKKEGVKPNLTGAMKMHAICADIFSTYVDDAGMVDYKSLRRKRLDIITVLSQFATLDPAEYASWSTEDNLAFWINAYNLYTIKAVIDNYPIQPSRFKMIFYPANSVMQISGMYDKFQATVMGEQYTLTEIEQKILRGQFSEPRVCLAINYASVGSAPLRREPYYGKRLNEQLEDQAKRFLSMDKGLKINRDESAIYLSPLFEWYGPDFAAKIPVKKNFTDRSPAQAAVLTFIVGHVAKKDADWLVRKMYPVNFIRFNWTLNEQH